MANKSVRNFGGRVRGAGPAADYCLLRRAACVIVRPVRAAVAPIARREENRSLSQPITASSTDDDAGRAPEFAVDGDRATRWSSAYRDPQWIAVDLQAVCRVDRVRLVWETAYARAYRIQVSMDGTAWRDVYTTTRGAGGTEGQYALRTYGCLASLDRRELSRRGPFATRSCGSRSRRRRDRTRADRPACAPPRR